MMFIQGAYYISKATMLLLYYLAIVAEVALPDVAKNTVHPVFFDIGIHSDHSPTFSRRKTIAPKKFAFVRVKNVKSCFLPFDQEV